MRLPSQYRSLFLSRQHREDRRRDAGFDVSIGLICCSLILLGLVDGGVVIAESAGPPQELPKPKFKTTPPLFQEWNFNKDQVDASPAGFSSQTIGEGSEGTWTVQRESSAPSRPHVLVQKPGCRQESCYQVLLADGPNLEYLDLSVRMKLVLGASTGKGGLVFGAQDSRNFYAVVVTPETNSLEGFLVKDGQLRSLGKATVEPSDSEWHFLRVHRNTMISHDLIEVFFDNHRILSLSDSSLGEGQVGLVTLGQGAFAFDNLRAMELLTERPLSRPPAY